MNAARQVRAILELPFVVLVIIPAALILAGRDARIGWSVPLPLSLLPPAFGLAVGSWGLLLMAQTISLFSRVGKGTLAPWDPTQSLVVEGPYRHVRNPMIVGVFLVLLGEGAGLGSRLLLLWFALFVVGNLVYVPLVEERGLERRFGDSYREYRANVPRWVPRLRAWEPRESERTGPGAS